MQNCKQCNAPYAVSAAEETFLKKIGMPAPEICPACRSKELMCWRNERTFYPAKCLSCGKAMVSSFSPNSPLKVWCNACWWSDKFNPLDYGRDFDFSRPFFEQYWELLQSTPVGNLFIANSENSEYSTYAVGNKNCYMASASDYNQDSFYVDNSNYNRDVGDVSMVNKSELIYESADIVNSYMCLYSQNLTNSNFCFACADLIGCSNCVGSVGLRNAQYYIFNKKYSKEEYEKEVARMGLNSYSNLSRLLDRYKNFELTQPRKFSNNVGAEQSVGNHILNSKNCSNSFDLSECQDCRNVIFGYKGRDCSDLYGAAGIEIGYRSVGIVESYNVQFSTLVWPGSLNIYYSFCVRTAKNCFGCVSLHGNEYCILNKQYSKEESEKMLVKIRDHMVKTGEWGKFFPLQFSPWAYNETVAQDFFPKTKEEAIAGGARWEDQMPGTFGKATMMVSAMPDDIGKTPDAVTNEILECGSCKRNYRVIAQELEFYKKIGVPLPRKCPPCRYRDRMSLRTPRHLWTRKCMNDSCTNEFQTSYAPDRPEIVYCEECYRKVTG